MSAIVWKGLVECNEWPSKNSFQYLIFEKVTKPGYKGGTIKGAVTTKNWDQKTFVG